MALTVALILVCAHHWDWTFPAAAQACVDEARVQERVVTAGPQEPPYQLDCPQEPMPAPGPPFFTPAWQKDCRPLPAQDGKAYLEFASISLEDQGNYTCVARGNSTYTLRLVVKESPCSGAPAFQPDGDVSTFSRSVGSSVTLNCTALLHWKPADGQCDTTPRWRKDGRPLTNHTLYTQNTTSWSPAAGQLMVNSLLTVSLAEPDDFGTYSCSIWNNSAQFCVHSSGGPSHAAAVIAAFLLLLLLFAAAIVYSRCHLDIKLWYRNTYGDYELNDGKLYDAYISYVSNDHDRKFVNFILKPYLEKKNAYKVHLNDNDVLPGGEPSAELLMNMSRSRRLIVLLSYAYLEQDWCSSNFRQGLLRLLELCQHPAIVIVLEGQAKRMRPDIKQVIGDHQHRLTTLTWRHNSVTPSSGFWKELALAMPRRLVYGNQSAGDPQTTLQDDKDPMLTLNPDYLDCSSDTDPAGDLGTGLRLPVYKALASKAPVLPTIPIATPEPSDIDVSDLGSRNYGARSDFYCLVTEADV